MRISDWSSDVCSSDLRIDRHTWQLFKGVGLSTLLSVGTELGWGESESDLVRAIREPAQQSGSRAGDQLVTRNLDIQPTLRSEEHTSELQSLMRISYAVFCLKKKTKILYILKQTKHQMTTRKSSVQHHKSTQNTKMQQ